MTEVWLTGPVTGVPSLLQPAAHAFLQVRQELPELLSGLSTEQIWQKVGDSASIGFHAMHLAGATDRLLTYARGQQLTDAQVAEAKGERNLPALEANQIIDRVNAAMDAAITQIRSTKEETLRDLREVGRQKLPSNVLGLIFHAAEHASRHAGQITTLRKIVATSPGRTATSS